MFLHKNDINQLLTKYYYKDSQLCYQILAQTKDDKTFVIQDFISYSDYKRAIVLIEEKIESGTVIEVKQYASENFLLAAVA